MNVRPVNQRLRRLRTLLHSLGSRSCQLPQRKIRHSGPPVPSDHGLPKVRYIAELVPSLPAAEPPRRRTRLQSRRTSWMLPDPNVFTDSDVEVGAVLGRRAAGSSTTSA